MLSFAGCSAKYKTCILKTQLTISNIFLCLLTLSKNLGFWDRVYFTKAVLKLPLHITLIHASTTATLGCSFHSGHPVCNSLDLHERLSKISFLKCTDVKRTVTGNFQLFSDLIFVFTQVSQVNAVYFWWLTVHLVVCATTPVDGTSAWHIYSNEFPKMQKVVNVKFT